MGRAVPWMRAQKWYCESCASSDARARDSRTASASADYTLTSPPSRCNRCHCYLATVVCGHSTYSSRSLLSFQSHVS